MTNYVLSREARRDVLKIVGFIATDCPGAALRARDRLFEAFGRLAARPALGHARPDLTDKPVRFWPVARRYLIVYRGDRAWPRRRRDPGMKLRSRESCCRIE